jgi:glycosyltransferase involved in cell wall biosynthesis
MTPVAPVNVLHVSTGLGQGGAEAALVRLLTYSDPQRVRHHVLALSVEGPLWAQVMSNSAGALNLLFDRPIKSVGRVVRLPGFMKQAQPTVIHGWMYHGNLFGSWLRNRFARSANLIFGIRQSIYDIGHERPLTRSVVRMGARRSLAADAVVYNSETARVQHTELGYESTNSLVIPNGFDTSMFAPNFTVRGQTRRKLGLADSDVVFAIVGRYHQVKDHGTFIAAAARACRELPNLRFLIVGPNCSWENAALKSMVMETGAAERFQLLGTWSEPASLYPALDGLCLTSLSEGFPNVVGEAMATAVPCICTAIGDVPLLMGDTGFIVKPRDVDGFTRRMLDVAMLAPEDRAAMGNKARQRIVGGFDINKVVERYVSLYERLAFRPRKMEF